MNQNKKSSGWVLCSSKSFPGKHYYFNVLNGETAWTLTENEVEKTKKQIQYSTIHSNYPEPLTKPPEDALSNTPTNSQPKTPSTTLPRPEPPVTAFCEAVFPIFPPTKDLPNFVWAAVPVKYYINDANIPSFEARKSTNTSFDELINEKHQTTEDIQIVVQVHTNNDQYVSKRFVTYNKVSNPNETNKKTKNTKENPFLSSTPNPPIQPNLYNLFNKNDHNFSNDTPNIQLTNKTEYNNKTKYMKDQKFIYQSTNNNSEHEQATFNFHPSINEDRNVIRNSGFITPNTTTCGNRFDTPNKTVHLFDTPKKTTVLDTPGFGIHTPNKTFYNAKESILCNSKTNSNSFDMPDKATPVFGTPKKFTFGIDTPKKIVPGFDTPKKIVPGFDTPNKIIPGFDTPYKIIPGLDTPNKIIPDFDTPITKEVQTKIAEKAINLLENDLRNVLLQRKRRLENSSNNEENSKKMKTSYNEKQATPKKRVTFQLDMLSDISSDDFSDSDNNVLETSTSKAVESFTSLRCLGATDDIWYIVLDLDTLLDNFEFIDGFVNTDPLCRLLVPYSVYMELTTTSTACGSRARVISARNVLRRLECGNTKYRVQNPVIGWEKLKSQKDQIQCCIIELIGNNVHVVLITNNDILYKEAKEKRIKVYKISQIRNGEPNTPDVTFDIQKIKVRIPNDISNSKGENVENFDKQTVKKNDQKVAIDNNEKKIDEKYKKYVQNFWRGNTSDSDFSGVSEQIQNLNLSNKTFFENVPKKTHITSKKQAETVTSNLTKPMTNVVIVKNVLQNGSASKDSLFGNNYKISASTMSENHDNDNQNYTLKNSTSKAIENHDVDNPKPTFVEKKQLSIFKKPASKEPEYYPNGINRNFISTNPASENNNQQKSPFKNENQSHFENPVSKESENYNQYSIFKTPVSKKPENHEKDNRNSIFEIDSDFMPLTSKIVEDYLKTFNIKNKMVEDCLKNSMDEKICCFRQVLEDLAVVLKEYSSNTDNSRACILYNILQKIRKTYGKHKLIRDVIEKLHILLYRSECIDKIRLDLLPLEIMQAIGCGLLLVKQLKELTQSEHLIDIEKGLNDLIQNIENPIYIDCIETPLGLRSEKNDIYDENRINFKKDDLEIIQYLKKHYPAWTDFDETTVSMKQTPEIKIFRTFGKNLNRFTLNRSRIIVEKAIENDEANADPKSIQRQQKDKIKTGNIERDNHSVLNIEEKDKNPNPNDKKLKKTETSAFFENFDIEKELQCLKNTGTTEPKITRLLSNDKDGEKTNFDSKKTDSNSKYEVKIVENTKKTEPKVIRVFSKDNGGGNTNFDSKMTDFDLNQTEHGNTFEVTESGPKILRNIALIPKYEDLLKKSIQNGPLITKTVQNGIPDQEISLSDTENLTNEDFTLEKPKIDENNQNISNKAAKKSENFENKIVLDDLYLGESSMKCYSISDKTSDDVIIFCVENNLKAAISIFFSEIINCFQNIHSFIESSFSRIKKTENSTELNSIEYKAKEIHSHIVRIIEKLSVYKEAKGENMNFSFFHLIKSEGNSTDSYITKCRQLSSLCIEQAKMLEKMVNELCNSKHWEYKNDFFFKLDLKKNLRHE